MVWLLVLAVLGGVGFWLYTKNKARVDAEVAREKAQLAEVVDKAKALKK